MLIEDSSLLLISRFAGLSIIRCDNVVVLLVIYPLHCRIEVLLEYKHASGKDNFFHVCAEYDTWFLGMLS